MQMDGEELQRLGTFQPYHPAACLISKLARKRRFVKFNSLVEGITISLGQGQIARKNFLVTCSSSSSSFVVSVCLGIIDGAAVESKRSTYTLSLSCLFIKLLGRLTTSFSSIVSSYALWKPGNPANEIRMDLLLMGAGKASTNRQKKKGVLQLFHIFPAIEFEIISVNCLTFFTLLPYIFRRAAEPPVQALWNGIEALSKTEFPFQGFGGPKCPLKKPYLAKWEPLKWREAQRGERERHSKFTQVGPPPPPLFI